MANTWFRLYHDLLNDEKIISLAFEDQRHFIGVLILKSNGTLDKNVDDALLDRIVAQNLWIDHAIIRDVKKRLFDVNLIDSSWQPLAWNKRQKQSDNDSTNAERQRRYREKNNSNALRNGEVTDTDKNRIEENREDKQEFTSSVFNNEEIELIVNYRKSIKSKLKTQQGFKGLENKLLSVMKEFNITLIQALKVMADNEWKSIEIDWVKKKGIKPIQAKKIGGVL